MFTVVVDTLGQAVDSVSRLWDGFTEVLWEA